MFENPDTDCEDAFNQAMFGNKVITPDLVEETMKSNGSLLGVFCFSLLSACGPAPTPEVEEVKEPQAVEETTENIQPAANSVQKNYCFERAGQVNQDSNQEEPRRGGACKVHAAGAGGYEKGLGSPARNTASLLFNSPSFESLELKTLSIALNRKSNDPKFTTGIQSIDQVRILTTEDKPLPDFLVFGSSTRSDFSMSILHTSPDANHLRSQPPIDIPLYETVTAVLAINRVIDIPVEPFEAEFSRMAGMIMGKQYIEGTFTLLLVPIASTGQAYGPVTFEFGTTLDWGYSKSMHEGE